MFFRQAGIRHIDYAADRALFPLPADRIMIATLLVFALAAPWLPLLNVSGQEATPRRIVLFFTPHGTPVSIGAANGS